MLIKFNLIYKLEYTVLLKQQPDNGYITEYFIAVLKAKHQN
jgi:hypothetical protein